MPVQIGKYCDKSHPNYKYNRGNDAFEYSIGHRFYRKTKPPGQKIIFFHRFIVSQPTLFVNEFALAIKQLSYILLSVHII